MPRHLVDEFRSLARTSFLYSEPTDPQSFASSVSTSLPFYPPEKWLAGPAAIGEGGEAGCAQMLAHCMEPRNAIITLVAKSNEAGATRTEPIYGTKYGTVSLAREVDAWRTSAVPPELAPPQPNPFLPQDFTIRTPQKSTTRDGVISPVVLTDELGTRVHFLPDATFNRPKAFAFFLFRSSLLSSSAKASVTSQLFQSILADTLQDSTYQASLAGLGAG